IGAALTSATRNFLFVSQSSSDNEQHPFFALWLAFWLLCIRALHHEYGDLNHRPHRCLPPSSQRFRCRLRESPGLVWHERWLPRARNCPGEEEGAQAGPESRGPFQRYSNARIIRRAILTHETHSHSHISPRAPPHFVIRGRSGRCRTTERNALHWTGTRREGESFWRGEAQKDARASQSEQVTALSTPSLCSSQPSFQVVLCFSLQPTTYTCAWTTFSSYCTSTHSSSYTLYFLFWTISYSRVGHLPAPNARLEP
ncbi:hypothetical protein C8F04DRAFT_1387950, partial [Mycena alexandri]